MIQEKQGTVTLFESHKQLSEIIDENHPLVKLADSIDWKRISAKPILPLQVIPISPFV